MSNKSNGVATTHPQFDQYSADQKRVRDAVRGQTHIRSKGEAYLPKSGGQKAIEVQSKCDTKNSPYHAYKEGARFPDITSFAREGFVGLATRKKWTIEGLPPALEYLEKNAGNGLPLKAWQGFLIEEGLTVGRYGLFPDAPVKDKDGNGGGNPTISWYQAESIINWKEEGGDPCLAVLKERVDVANSDEFSHDKEDQYRVIRYVDGKATFELYDNDQNTAEVETPIEGDEDSLPFYIGGAVNNDWDVDKPPLIAIANCAIAYYQLSAQQRWAIRATCDPTFLALGFKKGEIKFMGGGGIIEKEVDPKLASLTAIEVEGTGIDKATEQMRFELEQAKEHSHQLTDKSSAEASSTLRQRVTSKTASLKSVDRCAAEVFENALNRICRMMKLPDNVTVTSSFDYTDDEVDAVVLSALSKAVALHQLPAVTVTEYVQDRGVLEGHTAEEVEALIEGDRESAAAEAVGFGSDTDPDPQFIASQ